MWKGKIKEDLLVKKKFSRQQLVHRNQKSFFNITNIRADKSSQYQVKTEWKRKTKTLRKKRKERKKQSWKRNTGKKSLEKKNIKNGNIEVKELTWNLLHKSWKLLIEQNNLTWKNTLFFFFFKFLFDNRNDNCTTATI